jgi:hypothetical protein
MYTLLMVLPAIVSLLLWVHWFDHGAAGRIWKIAVLFAILGAAALQAIFDRPLLGLLLQVPIAIGLLVWNRWNAARQW